MIDFNNADYLKLRVSDNNDGFNMVSPMLLNTEEIFATFKTIRDTVVFTNKRVITINVQGVTGKKKDFTSLPYSKIQAFSVETAGLFDVDTEMELWFSGLGKVHFEFISKFDITTFNKYVGEYIL